MKEEPIDYKKIVFDAKPDAVPYNTELVIKLLNYA